MLALAVPVAVAACAADPATAPAPDTDVPAALTSARDQLAALAAAAQDRRLTARYILSTGDAPDRTVEVTRATDGTWRVDIPRGALGGTADVSVARTREGLFQCALAPAQPPVDPAEQWSPTAPAPDGTDAAADGAEPGSAAPLSGPACVLVADPDGRLPGGVDPRVQLPFTDWLAVLTDRRAPLAVSTSTPPPGVRGSCFAVESTSASLTAPLDVGVYCFEADGTLTGARLGLGDLALAGAPAPPPPTVTLPGPVVAGEPLSMAAPPSPTTHSTDSVG